MYKTKVIFLKFKRLQTFQDVIRLFWHNVQCVDKIFKLKSIDSITIEWWLFFWISTSKLWINAQEKKIRFNKKNNTFRKNISPLYRTLFCFIVKFGCDGNDDFHILTVVLFLIPPSVPVFQHNKKLLVKLSLAPIDYITKKVLTLKLVAY